MSYGRPFFTTKAERSKLDKHFLDQRKDYFGFDKALLELTQPIAYADVDADSKLYFELAQHIIIPSWQAFESFPENRRRDFIAIINHKQQNDEPTNMVEVGVIGALSKILKAMTKK